MPGGPPGLPPAGGGGGSTKPPATTTYTPPPPRAAAAVPIFVRRHDGTPLPNVRVVDDQWREFEPPVAHLRYVLDDRAAASGDPSRVEQVFPLTARGRRVLKVDDRIRVVRRMGTRAVQILFDGFVVAPHARLGDKAEAVTLTAIATPHRERDTPLPGAIYRDSDGLDDPMTADGRDPVEPQDVATDLPTRFNPDGKPNATPAGSDSVKPADATNPSQQQYPVFADHELPESRGLRKWTLAMAVRYCMVVGNPTQKYVLNGLLPRLDELFKVWRPAAGHTTIDPSKPESYVKEDITVDDVDVTGMPWPDAVRRLIEPYGFAFRFDLSTKASGEPEWRVAFYRKDDNLNVKPAYLQKPPAALVPGRSTAAELDLTRDCAGVENRWVLATRLVRYEASVILAPGFTPDPDDYDLTRRYVKGMDVTDALFDPDLYRTFILDEAGDGHWLYDDLGGIGSWSVHPADLRAVLQPGADGKAKRTYVHRRRPPLRTLISKDARGERRHAELWVSNNYQAGPGVWDGGHACPFGTKGGDWQRVTKGGWRLLDDRIGIELTMPNPRDWQISDPHLVAPGVPYRSGMLNIPAAVTAPAATRAQPQGGRPYFRLTLAFAGDRDMRIVAGRRAASASKFPITRYADVRDRFRKDVVSTRSHVAQAAGFGFDHAKVDDTRPAEAFADGKRRAHECGAFAGSVTIRSLSDAYQLGDKVSKLAGRNLDLAMNGGRNRGEAPIYPVVVGRDRHFEGGQYVVYQWVDFRAEPPPAHRGMEGD